MKTVLYLCTQKEQTTKNTTTMKPKNLNLLDEAFDEIYIAFTKINDFYKDNAENTRLAGDVKAISRDVFDVLDRLAEIVENNQ